jgi:hypothetical protein
MPIATLRAASCDHAHQKFWVFSPLECAIRRRIQDLRYPRRSIPGLSRAQVRAMNGSIIVMPGLDPSPLHAVAAEFGWEVQEGNPGDTVAPKALLLHRQAFGPGKSWLEVIRLCRFKFPEVRLIVCHGLPDSIDWPELSRTGAFHALSLPLKESELRQSLGFVWEAEQRLAAGAQKLLEIAPARTPNSARRTVHDRLRGFYAPHVDYEQA